MLASLVKGLCSNPHSPGRKPYLSRVKRVTLGISLGGVRREVSKKASFPGLDFRYDKRRPPTKSNPAEKPGKGRASSVFPTHRFCGGGKKRTRRATAAPERGAWPGDAGPGEAADLRDVATRRRDRHPDAGERSTGDDRPPDRADDRQG